MFHVTADDLKSFCLELLACCEVRADVAHHVATGLAQASLRGVDSHGVRLLPHYIRALESGRLNPQPAYCFNRTSPSTGTLDGDNTFGHAAGAEGMSRAIELAQENGMGSVAVSNSSHFGAAAYFSLMAAQEGMVGFSFTHADSLMLSYNGTRPYFGTNPISFAAPCLDDEPLCLDMATTTVTWNKMLKVSAEGQPIPEGWGVDGQGTDTTDPDAFAALHPIGGYKGFGLSMMVDVLCSLLTGMPFGRHISRMYGDPMENNRHLGHFFMALRVDCFAPAGEFQRRMGDMMDEVRSEPPHNSAEGVQVPGDPERRVAEIRRRTGIPVSEPELAALREVAQKYELDFPAGLPENQLR